MKKVLGVLKAVVAALNAAAGAVAVAAVPDNWKAIAAVIAAVTTTLSVYFVPNIKA